MPEFHETVQRFARSYTSLPTAVHLLCLGSFINRVGSFVMLFLTIYVSEHLGMGKPFASACVGMFGVGSVLSALIGGHIADTAGRRTTMLIALFGGSLLLASLSLITNGLLFMAALCLFAFIVEMYRPASSAMIGDVANPTQRPFAFSLLFLSFNLGFAIAPQIGGWLASRSYTLLFIADAATTALFGLVVLLFIRETHPTSARSVKTQTAEDVSLKQAVRTILRDSNFLLFSLSCLLTNIVFMQAFVTLPLALHEKGYSELEFGRMICVNGLLIVLLQLPLTPLLNRLPQLHAMIGGQLLLAAGFALTGFAHSTFQIVASIVLWTLGEICQAPFKPTIVTEMAPPQLRARYMGIFNMTYSASIAIGAPLGGWILNRWGPLVLWPGAAITLLLTNTLYLIVFRRMQRYTGQ
jgi:MFS family permease